MKQDIKDNVISSTPEKVIERQVEDSVTSSKGAPSVHLTQPQVHSHYRNIVYLASPYTHPDTAIRAERFRLATEAAASLIRQGYIVYSPITMTHPIDIVLAGSAGTLGSDYWVQFDEAFMDMCSEMIILNIPGWESSNGVKREIEYFWRQRKRVRLMTAPEATPSLLNWDRAELTEIQCCQAEKQCDG